jgi:phosphate transport system protein
MIRQTRQQYQVELHSLEADVQQMGAYAQKQLERSIRLLNENDAALEAKIIERDDRIDDWYLDVERRILDLFALQTPVASDLRLLTSLLHVVGHLERVGDMAVNIAKITGLAADLPKSPRVVQMLEEMGGIALKMIAAAMDAFARRDLELCRTLPEMDEPIDELNKGMLAEVLAIADDKRMLEWGIRMHVISRQLERVGDHAVDIAEQVSFLLTGEFHEFTDASHPEIEHPETAIAPDDEQG